jgi:outer membrane protein TolC
MHHGAKTANAAKAAKGLMKIKTAMLATALVAGGALALGGAETTAARTTRDITLDDAVQIALRQNPSILTAEQEIKRTRGVVLEVQAQALPQVVATSDFAQVDKGYLTMGGGNSSSSSSSSSSSTSSTSGTSGGSSSGGGAASSSAGSSSGASAASANPMTQSWNVTVTASQLIYSGGEVAAAIHIAKHTQDATIYSLRDVVDTVIANVRSQFYAVLLDRAIIKVQEENIALLGKELKDQQNRFEAGIVPRFNVLQAEVAVANARPQLIQARNDYNVAILNLARSLGINKETFVGSMPPVNPVGILTTDEKPEVLQQAIELARERRPFLKEQREQIVIQLENIKIALAGYQPKLSVDGGYEVRNNSASKQLDKVVYGWFYGISGSWDVFDGGATYGRTKQAKAELEEAKTSYDDAVRQVDVEVEQAWDQVHESQDTIVSQEKAIEEAQEALRLAQERLTAGAGVQLDVLSAQVALTQARTTLVQAQYNYDIAMAQFDRVTAANTRWQELFRDPLVERQRSQEGLPSSSPSPAPRNNLAKSH